MLMWVHVERLMETFDQRKSLPHSYMCNYCPRTPDEELVRGLSQQLMTDVVSIVNLSGSGSTSLKAVHTLHHVRSVEKM